MHGTDIVDRGLIVLFSVFFFVVSLYGNFSADVLALKKWLMTLLLQPATPQEQKYNLLIKRLAHLNFTPFFCPPFVLVLKE